MTINCMLFMEFIENIFDKTYKLKEFEDTIGTV
jgi:hypothetical protein